MGCQLERRTYLRSARRKWVDDGSLEWSSLLERNPLLGRQEPPERSPPLGLHFPL